MATQKITYGDKTDGVSSATSADFNEIKEVVNNNSDAVGSSDSSWGSTLDSDLRDNDQLLTGELIGDGTDSFVTSAGREPVVASVEVIPGKSEIDGIRFYDELLKWPGRAVYGLFRDYTNVAAAEPTVSADVSYEGDWIKVTANSNKYAYVPYTAITDGYISVMVRKGNTNNSVVYLTTSTASVAIDWSAKTTTFTHATDKGTKFISDEVVQLKFIDTTGGSTQLRLYGSNGSGSSGDYSYYKNYQVVDITYPVPYTAKNHIANKWKYNWDWTTSSTWTIEGWFKDNQISVTSPIVNTRETSSAHGIAFNWGGAAYRLRAYNPTETNIIVTGINSNTWNYYKIVLSSGKLDIYINGGTAQSITTGVPAISAMSKVLYLGCYYGGDRFRNSYMSDIRITSISDTTTTHYTLNKPWYDPGKTYGKDGLWGVDEHGDISGKFRGLDTIISSGKKGSQIITKWSGGRMEIRVKVVTTSGGTITINFEEDFYDTDYYISGLIESAAARSTTIESPTISSVIFHQWTSGGGAANSTGYYTIIGRWKE